MTTRIPGAPPLGTTEDVEYLDQDHASWSAYLSKMVESLVSLGYRRGQDLHGAPYDFRRAANEQEEYFTQLVTLIRNTYEKVR